MDDFVFPSDQARAESPDLDRVCCYLEAQMESHSDNSAAKLAEAITNAAVKAGGVEPGIELSGPQLLLAVNDMAEAIISFQRPSETLSEGEIHKVAKRHLNKRRQGLFMGDIRKAIYGHNDRGPRPVSDCCCGETEETWRLCPQHKHITGSREESVREQ